jgi:hypothetical protein
MNVHLIVKFYNILFIMDLNKNLELISNWNMFIMHHQINIYECVYIFNFF